MTQQLENPGFYPLCFISASKYERWKLAARRAEPGESDYCADCTPDYKLEMIVANRCAYPRTVFRSVHGADLEGVRLDSDLARPKKSGA